MIRAYPMKGDKDNMYVICYNLLYFSNEKGLLLKSPIKEDGLLDTKTIIRESDWTDLGKRVFNDLMFKTTDKQSFKIRKRIKQSCQS
ncbi:MAG: hypothetical protein LBD59_08595 [Prevotellaceae bacterium]|jgi:hypothetical protein|nr:hypothetical protein [Prevotellaceae bacterium]